MDSYEAKAYYVDNNGVLLYTVVCLPEGKGKFPTVIIRTPYIDDMADKTDKELEEIILGKYLHWMEKGYAVVFQHCRGRGRSGGDFIPYVYECEDGLCLQEWIRKQSFYNGELYLVGSSYLATVHFVTAPFADDVKGAVLRVQDCERYNVIYRNGMFKSGLHGSWYVTNYKKKSGLQRNYTAESFNMLPLTDFSRSVFGESALDFDEVLLHPDRNDIFWTTKNGGADSHEAIKYAGIPILLTTSFYDIYTGGVFDMWNGLDGDTREKCALLVRPYDHGDKAEGQPVVFENGASAEVFGNYPLQWIEYIRGKAESPFPVGKVTYYKLFGNKWCTDDFAQPKRQMSFTLGEGEQTYTYDPSNPASFKGGLSTTFGGNAWQDEPGLRSDILTFYTPEFSEDTFIKGKIKARLKVRSDCEDTCFYMRLSIVKKEGYYGLRDDITQISNFIPDYVPNTDINVEFSFDEHAFVVQKGEKIRIDVSSSAYPRYVRHTNNRGLYSVQKTAKIAKNTVVCNDSCVILPVE